MSESGQKHIYGREHQLYIVIMNNDYNVARIKTFNKEERKFCPLNSFSHTK